MQKIIIKNFGAIEYAEIEIKKVVVLIGEQASGKSTIAKLIYFFKTLRDDIFNQIYQDKQKSSFSELHDIKEPAKRKFYNFFGATSHLPKFEIKFYYNFEANKCLDVTLDQKKQIQLKFSANFFNKDFKNFIQKIKTALQKNPNTNIHEQLAYEQQKIEYAHKLLVELTNLLYCNQLDSLFVIAGRNVTVSYSEVFEKYLFASVQSRLEKNSTQRFEQKEQAIDETLMLKFIERAAKVKSTFRQFRDIDSLIEFHPKTKEVKQILSLVKKKMYTILKGEYIIDNFGEKIIPNTKTKVSIDLANTSSGQQEVIRIIQDIFICILEKSKILRIVEEPEAHLFPVAQKSLVELLALMVNQNDDNQLIITTHSPYVLTVFNNLLFAQRVVDKNPSAEAEVVEIIPKEFWLKAKDFSAYSLGNSSIEEEHKYCESIFNQQTGAIKQNYLDAVSEMLGGDFDTLYSIYTKSVRRR